MREHRNRIGNRTEGVASDVAERDRDAAHAKRIWFLMRDLDVNWLGTKDTSVMLWVLALLLLAWALVFLILHLL